VNDECFGKNVAGSGSCLNLSYGRDGKNAKYIRIADLLVLPNTNRSEKHNVQKAVAYVSVYIHIYIYHILCRGVGEGAIPKMGEFLYKSQSKKIGPTDFQIGERGQKCRPAQHRTLHAILWNSIAIQ
jgi:hypothetical protein